MADQRPIGFWLKLVDRLIDERFESVLDEHGVTRRQWQLLNLLSRGPATREELDVAVAPFLAAVGAPDSAEDEDPAAPGGAPSEAIGESTAADLEELVESDWVADSVSGFVLTPRGEQSHGRLAEVVADIRSSISDGVDEAAYDTTVQTLERMAQNLGWRETPSTAQA